MKILRDSFFRKIKRVLGGKTTAGKLVEDKGKVLLNKGQVRNDTELEHRLGAAQELMPVWRRPEVEEEWVACEAGIEESLMRARRLREDPPELGGFEGLIWAVDRLLAPLADLAAGLHRRLAAGADAHVHDW